jgi:hypothetical protein
MGFDPERVELVMNQFVTLSSGGKTVKQSTRRATFITTDELAEEVGVDVFRFFMVERKAEAHLDFQLDLAKETDWSKNPAYYVQYAHARALRHRRQAAEGACRPQRAGRGREARAARRDRAAAQARGVSRAGGARRGSARAAPRGLLPARRGGALEPVRTGRQAPPFSCWRGRISSSFP